MNPCLGARSDVDTRRAPRLNRSVCLSHLFTHERGMTQPHLRADPGSALTSVCASNSKRILGPRTVAEPETPRTVIAPWPLRTQINETFIGPRPQ
jgi:hypothetical protein